MGVGKASSGGGEAQPLRANVEARPLRTSVETTPEEAAEPG